MIVPNARAQFTYSDLRLLSEAMWGHQLTDREAGKLVNNPDLFNRTLDDKRVLRVVNDLKEVDNPSPALYFYMVVRHALLSEHVTNEEVADYVASLLTQFGQRDRAWRVDAADDEIYNYFVDLDRAGIEEHQPWRKFRLHTHLGNFALWMAGLFPQHIQQKRKLSVKYVDGLGRKGFLKASLNPQAKQLDMAELFEALVDNYLQVRTALNSVGEAVWPSTFQ